MANSTKIRKRAKQLKARPVRVTLHDGRSYVGWITGFEKEGLVLSTQRRNSKSKRKPPSRSQKATVSGLLPLFGLLFGNMGGGATGATSTGNTGFGGLGFLSMIQRSWPVMRMGYSTIRSIIPLIGGIKGLMG
ncbi:hypothetical protein ACP8HI_21225 [Paenibacillus sp. FA6]|uniref:hypothetical protein n=1 Tax=Paenibacillus sp. FA6 TaxID=3413029 RepID=UPI003F659DC2